MTAIIPKVDAADLASVAALAGQNIITEDELSLSRAGSQGGFHFDGSNDYQDVTTDDFGTSDFSLVYDILWDDTPSGTEYLSIRSAGNNKWYFYVGATTFNLLIVDGVGGTNTYTWTVTPSVNHRNVTVTADRSGNATLYLNGKSQGTVDISGDSAVELGSGNNNAITLGHSTNSFDGRMYQVRFYSDVLTTGEVKELAKGNHVSDNLWLHYSPTSTEENGWRDISENDRSSVNNGATRIESSISKSFTSHSEEISNKVVGPAYYFDGSTSEIDVSGNAYNSNSITFLVVVKPDNSKTSGSGIILGGLGSGTFTNRRYFSYAYDTQKYFLQYGDSTQASAITSATTGRAVVIGLIDTSLGTLKTYINGVLQATDTLTAQYDNATVPITTGDIGQISGASKFQGEISEVRLFNRALTDSEVLDVSHGKSLGYADTGADGTTATSGTLTVGKRYRIDTFNSGDDFTNIGAASNASGVEFIATGTTPTTWTNSSVVAQLGEVLSLLPTGIASGKWFDQGAGGYHGTLTGVSPINVGVGSFDKVLSLTNLPTSSAGLATGRVWNHNGHLAVV